MTESSNNSTDYAFGTTVVSNAGTLGRLDAMVVHPSTSKLTHLVVVPSSPEEKRLVPIDLVESVGDVVRINCDGTRFDALEVAEDLRPVGGGGESAPRHAPNAGFDGGVATFGATKGHQEKMVVDVVPDGEVQIHSGEHVEAADGRIGHVVGLSADSGHNIGRLILESGHLWAKSEFRIPMDSVVGFKHEIRLDLDKDAARKLKQPRT